MPLLTTLWVSQLVLFQHHVTADHRAQISLAGAVTWPRHGQSSGCISPLVPQHAVLIFLLLQPYTKRQRPTSHSRPISVLRSQMSTTYQKQPSAYQLKQEKSHNQPPSACHLITLQHLASPIQPILPTRPPVCLPFVITSLLKSKNTSKFSCFIQYTADYSFENEETSGFKRSFFNI